MNLKNICISFALIVAIVLGTVVAGTFISEYFYPKINYEIGPSPLIVAYETIPLDFEYLIKNTRYEVNEYNVANPAIQVKIAGDITINFSQINKAHFTEFKVEVWNLTISPNTLVGSFDLANIPLTFSSEIANYGYAFYFTTADVDTTGTITLEVSFQGES